MTTKVPEMQPQPEIPPIIVDPSPRSHTQYEKGRFLGKVSLILSETGHLFIKCFFVGRICQVFWAQKSFQWRNCGRKNCAKVTFGQAKSKRKDGSGDQVCIINVTSGRGSEGQKDFQPASWHCFAGKQQQITPLLFIYSLHRQLSHPYVVQMFSYFEDSNFVYIILELCRRRSLMELHKRRKAVTEPETRLEP